MLVKHCRGPSNRSQLVISPKKSRSLVASSLQDEQVSTNPSHVIGIPAWISGYKRSIGILDMLAPPEYLEEEITKAIKKALGTKVVEYRLLEQKRAVKVVVNKESPVVVVLPTSSKKSLTFIGAACLLQVGVTIVVAPF
jgi:hypothetical protein